MERMEDYMETLKLIGNTPMYHIKDTNIHVKLEKFNVGGSIKDRAVLGMLRSANAAIQGI